MAVNSSPLAALSFFFIVLGFPGLSVPVAAAAGPDQAIAFYYGSESPLPLCRRYRHVVVEADNFGDGSLPAECAPVVYAYVSVGEAERWRDGYDKLSSDWFLGENANWGSDIADLTRKEWQDYVVRERIARLWRQGYRGVFLDTLDSFAAVVTDPARRRAQEQALAGLVRRIHRQFPGIRLLLNRGFEILPQVHTLVTGVAAESLFRGWDPGSKSYVEVDRNSRRWLTDKLRQVQKVYGLPVTVIDYLDMQDPSLVRTTAQQIHRLGFHSWISVGTLDRFGTGTADLASP